VHSSAADDVSAELRRAESALLLLGLLGPLFFESQLGFTLATGLCFLFFVGHNQSILLVGTATVTPSRALTGSPGGFIR